MHFTQNYTAMLSTKQHCTPTQYTDLQFTDSTLLLYGQKAIKLKMELENPLCKNVKDFRWVTKTFRGLSFHGAKTSWELCSNMLSKDTVIYPKNLSGLRQLALKTLNSKTVLLFT